VTEASSFAAPALSVPETTVNSGTAMLIFFPGVPRMSMMTVVFCSGAWARGADGPAHCMTTARRMATTANGFRTHT